MEHFIILFYILSFTLGFSVILIVFFLWLKNRDKLLHMFLLCAVSLTLILIEQMITAYALTNFIESSAMKTILRFTSAAGCSLLIYAFTRLAVMLIERDISGRLKAGLVVYSLIPVAAALVYSFTGAHVALWTSSALFFLNILYNVVALLVHLNRIKISRIRSGIRNLAIVSLLLFSVLIADIFVEKIPLFGEAFAFGLFSVFVFYSIFGAMSLYYIVKGFNVLIHPPNAHADYMQQMPDAFRMTNREKEIIDYLLAGLTYRQIGEKLAISLPTVKTHVTNIYKKAGVQNKIELMNTVKKHHNHLI